MAAVVLTAVTVIEAGIAENTSSATTAGTITVSVGDMSRTFFRCQNDSTTASTILTFSKSADPMVAAGQGDLAVTLGTAESQYIGASWDSARLKSTSGTVVLTIAAAGTVTVDVGDLTPY